MLYHFLYPLRDVISGFNVFRYVTTRTAFAALTALQPVANRLMSAAFTTGWTRPLTSPPNRATSRTMLELM